MSGAAYPDKSFLKGGHLRRLLFCLTLVIFCFAPTLVFSQNAQASTSVGGTISQNTTWSSSGSPYIVQAAGLTIAQGATLNIQSGVTVKFEQPATGITVSGALNATGTIFTSINDGGGTGNPQPGDWHGIDFYGSGQLTGCTFRYGGYYTGSGYRGQVTVIGTSPVSVSGSSVFSNGYQYGLYVTGGALTPSVTGSVFSYNNSGGLSSEVALSTLSSNQFDHNNGPAILIPAVIGSGVTNNTYPGSTNKINGMDLTGHVYDNTEWPASNSPYVLEGVLPGPVASVMETKVQPGKTLTIDSGAVVKPKADLNGTIHANTIRTLKVFGTLNASGAIFTSYFDDANGGDTNNDGGAISPMPGDWIDIDFEGGSSGSISNSVVAYGGSQPNYIDYGEIYMNSTSALTISGSAIHHSLGSGINVGAGTPSIHFNDIFANGNGIYSSVSLNAANNYWGSKHGPKPYGFGNGFSGSVSAVPWSGIPFTQAGAAYQATLGLANYCAICGDPINTSTGAYVYNHSDVKVPTKGVPLEFERTYNSNDQSDGDLGFGWSYNWQASANPLANGNVVILRGDGRQDLFTLNSDGSYSPPAGRHDTLVKNPDGTYKLTGQDQVTDTFNSSNQLVAVTAENGQTTTLAYNANKQLTTVTEPTGRTLALSYNTSNRISQITDPAGNHISFAYSTAGDLTQATDQNGGVTSFAYDSFHHITSVTDPNGHASANNTYDAQGRVVAQTDADGKLLSFAYDSVNNKTIMTRQMDPNDASKDEVTVFYYDSLYRLVRETDPYGKDTLYTYDAAGNRDTVTDRKGTVTKQNFDAYGNVTDIYKAYGAPEQQHTSYTYNAKNHPLTKTNARGYTTSYTYDSSGSFLTQVAYPQVTSYSGVLSSYAESFTYNADGTKASFTDKNGNVTSYGYDSNGNLTQENRNTNRSSQDQVTLTYAYDALGRKTSAVDGNGHTTTFQYDNLGHLRYVVKQVTDPVTGQMVTATTENQYDAAGNRTKVIDPEGKATSYAFTPMNRLSQITDAKLNIIQYTYDAAGNKTGTKDRNGNWTYASFDKNNHMVSATDPENNTTTYAYDEEGNQTSVTDPLGRTTSKTYDRIGRVTTFTDPDEGGATRTTSYAYDAADNLTSTTDPLSHTATNAYDELGRLKQVTDPLGNSVYTAYDGLGNKVKTRDAKGSETVFAFSPNNFLITVTDPAGGVTNYAYDKNGNRTQQTDANGNNTLYAYDELDRLKEEKVDAGGGSYLLDRSYTYDKAGHQLTDTTADGTITSTYDSVYNLTGVTDRQGATYSYTYDANQSQLTAISNATGKTVSFSYSPRGELSQATDANNGSESYSYDPVGNLAQRQDTVANQNFTTSYAYTPRDQLKTVTKGTDTTSYTFDPARNLATKSYGNGISTSYSYDADNRLTSMQATKGGQSLESFSQAYDANSNVTSLTEPAGTDSYTYDSLNRLTNENLAAYGSVSYTYDKTGNRTTLTEPAPSGGPALALSITRTYWATYSDWLNHLLSIDYKVTDNGPGTAFNTRVTGATATNGVYLTSSVPVSLGNINQGGNAPFTFKYYIPSGVTSFSATVYSTCNDSVGASYYFPVKRSTYSYNQASQLTSLYNGQGTTISYSYNGGGALTQKSDGTSTTSLSYNGLDKLTQVATPATTVNYSYDALGRRISRTQGGSTANYHQDAKTDLNDYTTDTSGSLTASYQRGADGLISQTDYTGQSPVTSYDLYNPHGDTSAVTDQNGNVTGTYRYDSFGNPIAANSLIDGYTGKWQRDKDTSTGTIRMGAREYDPGLGRFISADPRVGEPTDPLQRNRYPYVGNNPLTRYDLAGNTWYKPWTWGSDDSESNESTQNDNQDSNPNETATDNQSTNDYEQPKDYGYSSSGCRLSGQDELNDKYLNSGGERVVGAFSIKRTGELLNGVVQVFTVTAPDRSKLTTSAQNPLLEEYAKILYYMRACAYAVATEGPVSILTDLLSDFPDVPQTNGPEALSYLAEKERGIFDQLAGWEECCGNY
ncbi:MAG: DUF6531 domain-containing protein [Thermoleophilia bacterium]